MSLDVPAALLERAERGDIDDTEFIDCVRLSLPYAWQVISGVVTDLELAGETAEFADHEIPPPTEAERGQLLRALASDRPPRKPDSMTSGSPSITSSPTGSARQRSLWRATCSAPLDGSW